MYPEHLPTALWAYASAVSSFPHNGFVGLGAFFLHHSPREENSNELLGDPRQENQKEMDYLRKRVRKLAQGGCASAQALPETRSASDRPMASLLSRSPTETENGRQHPHGWRLAEHRAPGPMPTES